MSARSRLPDFQRPWVWDDDHIRDLIASVSLWYPIGAVMLLEAGGAGARFRPRPVEGVTLEKKVPPEHLPDPRRPAAAHVAVPCVAKRQVGGDQDGEGR
jgi:hypothetical protein